MASDLQVDGRLATLRVVLELIVPDDTDVVLAEAGELQLEDLRAELSPLAAVAFGSQDVRVESVSREPGSFEATVLVATAGRVSLDANTFFAGLRNVKAAMPDVIRGYLQEHVFSPLGAEVVAARLELESGALHATPAEAPGTPGPIASTAEGTNPVVVLLAAAVLVLASGLLTIALAT
jgi:hypothetical protein